jgi:hypothetical protein
LFAVTIRRQHQAEQGAAGDGDITRGS